MSTRTTKKLTGVINSSDGLQDIPVKSHMQSNNFKIMSIPPGLYQSKKQKHSPAHSKSNS